MPVPKTQSDTMLSTQMDSKEWEYQIFPQNLLDEHFLDMRFLDFGSCLDDNLTSSFTSDNIDLTDILSSPASPKYQIRNHDCMWSGTCVDENHPSKKKGMSMCHRISAATTSTMSQQSQHQQQINDTFVNSSTQQYNNNNHQQRAIAESINNKYTATKAIMTPTLMKTIAPSSSSSSTSSLFINTRVNTNTAHFRINQNNSKCIDHKDFDSIISPSGLRPDTPLSLGDDHLPDFRQHIDLTPCPSGNRMKFNDPHSTKMINLLREHLEDSDTSSLVPQILQNQSKHQDLTEILTELTYLSDYEDAQDNSSNVDMDEEMTDEGIDMRMRTSYNNKSHQQASTSSTRTISHHEFISDHSYTLTQRSKEYYNDLGVCTPSDSDGESQLFLLYIHFIYFKISSLNMILLHNETHRIR